MKKEEPDNEEYNDKIERRLDKIINKSRSENEAFMKILKGLEGIIKGNAKYKIK